MKKILIYSDCYIFGGSEKLMTFILKNEKLNSKYDFNFGYRKHKIYEDGLKNEGLFQRKNNTPLYLLANSTLFYKINLLKIPNYLKFLLKTPFFILDKLNIYFIWNLSVLIYLLQKTKPNLIHINNGGYPAAKTCNTLVLANYLTIKKPIIYQINNQAKSRKYFWDKWKDSFINQNVKYFINASHSARKKLIEKRQFDGDKILLIDNCVALPSLEFRREKICKELNIPPNSFLIVEVAFLTERKGQKYLIYALSKLFERNPLLKEKIFCIFVGNGEDEFYLKTLIENFGLTNNVFMLGYKINSEDYIAASDLFVLPSIKDEDMPLALLSALGLGKPIISTNFAGISQAINSIEIGVLIENNLTTIEEDLIANIQLIYENEHLRKIMGENAQKRYQENYTPTSYANKLISIYESAK